MHEFGHYNAAYHDPMPAIYMTSVLDVAEIHSQGLELLITKYADEPAKRIPVRDGNTSSPLTD